MDSDDGYTGTEGRYEWIKATVTIFIFFIGFLAACKVKCEMDENRRLRQIADARENNRDTNNACENNRDTNYDYDDTNYLSIWWNGHENNRDPTYVSLDTVSPDYSPDSPWLK